MTRQARRLALWLAVVTTGSVVAAPAAAAAVSASVEAGVLTVRDDAGASTDLFVAPYSDLRPGGAPFYLVYPKDLATGQPTEARAGSGCSQMGLSAVCPSSSVQAISIGAGDATDHVTVGNATPGAPGTAQICLVPVTVDAGGGDDIAVVASAGQPVVLHGADGNDQLGAPAAASTVQEDGGPGDDSLSVAEGTGSTHPGSVMLDGGPGDDGLGHVGPGTATLRGGDGDDSIGVFQTTDPIDARGEGGNDTMDVRENRGPVLADAGAGNDKLRISRDDPDEARVGGGIVDARAGAGNDVLVVGDDGDRDLIDCGAGNDHFEFYLQGQTAPPRENRYTGCPIIGARLIGTAHASHRGRALVVEFRSPQRGSVRLQLLGPRSRLGRARARLRHGRTRVTVGLNRAGRRHLHGRYRDQVVVQAFIRSRTGDEQLVTRSVRVR